MNEWGMKDVKNFIEKNKFYILLLYIFTFAIYCTWLTQNIVTFDAEGFYSYADGSKWYLQWYELGRWAFVKLKEVFGVVAINPFFSVSVFLLLFPISVVLWWYNIQKWIGDQKNQFGMMVFSTIYLSHPIWSLQFAYRNQMEVICIVMVTLPIAVMLLTQELDKGRVVSFNIFLSLLLTVCCFGAYQSFMFMFAEAIILYFVIHLYNGRENPKSKVFWKKIFIVLIYTGVAYLLFGEIAKFMCKRHGVVYGNDYLKSQFKWFVNPFKDNIRTIFRYIFNTSWGDGVVYTKILTIEVLILIILFIINCMKKKKFMFMQCLCIIAMLMVPYLLTIVTASEVVHRSQFSFVFLVSFLGAYELEIILSLIAPKRITGFLILCTIGLFSFVVLTQIQMTTRLLYSDYVVMNLDEIQMREIYYEALKKGAHEGDAIVLIGGKANQVYDTITEYELVGYSYFEHTAFYGNDKLIEAMRAYGMNVIKPTEEQIQYACEVVDEMDCWPSGEDSIRIEEGLIIVCLSK